MPARDGDGLLGARAALDRARVQLTRRVLDLELQLPGDSTAWADYCAAVAALAAVVGALPAEPAPLIDTAEMARRLGLAPKTLLRHVAAGRVTPAIRAGKLLRWTGTERVNGR